MTMKHKSLIITLLTALAFLSSCKKVPLSVGKTVVQQRELTVFSHLTVNDDINMTLVRSDSCFIEVTAGENIIGNITTEVRNDTLIISNDNKINWIHTYDYRIDAVLHFRDISSLTYRSCGELHTRNQFNAEDAPYLIYVDGGSGDIFMDISHCSSLKVNYNYGTSQLNLTGDGNKFLNIHKRSYGLIHAENLVADSVSITNASTGDCWINANKYLYSRINHLGNIYYKGEPADIIEEYGEEAKGRLIKF